MVETASDFTGYIARYNIARSEGTLLRYLSDAYRSLARTVPVEEARRTAQRHHRLAACAGAFHRFHSGGRSGENAGNGHRGVAGRRHRWPRPAPATPWSETGEDSPCWCATPCSAVCSLWISTGPRSSARSTRTGVTACTNGRIARRLLRRARVCERRCRGPQRPRLFMLDDTHENVTSIHGRCARSSTIPMATTIGPSPAWSILTPRRTAAKWCSSTIRSETDRARNLVARRPDAAEGRRDLAADVSPSETGARSAKQSLNSGQQDGSRLVWRRGFPCPHISRVSHC